MAGIGFHICLQDKRNDVFRPHIATGVSPQNDQP